MIEATVEKRYRTYDDWEWCICFFGRAYPFGNDDAAHDRAVVAEMSFIEEQEQYDADPTLKRREELPCS